MENFFLINYLDRAGCPKDVTRTRRGAPVYFHDCRFKLFIIKKKQYKKSGCRV